MHAPSKISTGSNTSADLNVLTEFLKLVYPLTSASSVDLVVVDGVAGPTTFHLVFGCVGRGFYSNSAGAAVFQFASH